MTKYITLIAVVFFAAAGISSANLVINGHFETGNLTGWNWTPTNYSDPAMTTSVVIFDTAFGQPNLCFRVNPGTDNQHYDINQEEGGYLSQSLNLQASTEYDIEIGAAAIRDLGGGDNFDGGRIRLYIGSDLLWDWDIDSIAADTTVRNLYSGTYTPSVTGAYDLSVLFTRTYMNPPVIYHYLDNISVVPEPATMLLLGLGGLVLRRRKRRV